VLHYKQNIFYACLKKSLTVRFLQNSELQSVPCAMMPLLFFRCLVHAILYYLTFNGAGYLR
jgi:hypothetical protein